MDEYIGWSGPDLGVGVVEVCTVWLTTVVWRREVEAASGWDGKVVGYPGGRFVIGDGNG